jgi:methanogenic corrinoid protein MtbC1
MFEQLIEDYNTAIFDTDRHQAMEIIQKALSTGASPKSIIFDLVIPSMNKIIKSISDDFDANLAQHFLTAQIASEVTEMMISKMESTPKIKAKIIIGTAKGDMHSLGKKIVSGCLKAMMIETVDLGVNVPPEKFVTEALSIKSPIIAVSAMMMHTADGPNGPMAIRKILKERQLEHQIKLIVGGAPFRFDPELYKQVGADAVATDGILAGEIISNLIDEVKS